MMDLSKPLARGMTADVYAYKDGYVLKLFHRFSREDVEYEARIASAVYASGFAVPHAGEILEVDGRYGLVYERVDGPDMTKLLSQQPWRIGHFARRLAELHHQLHTCPGNAGIPNQRERLARKIRRATALPGPLQNSLLESLAAMPDGDRICHGDFHPGNILVTARGEVVIDWIDANCGNPLADVARTSVLLLGAAAATANPFMKGFIRLFHRLYLRQYFRLSPGAEQEYRRWLPIEAAARLAESIPQLEGILLALARQR